MTHPIELPPGYVICPKGGRPPKEARDVAVFLARQWRTGHLMEHTKTADDWILNRFKFSERSEIRRSIRKANAAHGINQGNWMMLVVKQGVFYLPGAIYAPIPGKKGWAWCDEMDEAIQIQAVNLNVKWGFGMASSP